MGSNRRVPSRITILFALTASATQLGAQVDVLDRAVGKDLLTLSKEDRSRLEQFLAPVPKGNLMKPGPWHVWKTTANGQSRYIVLLLESEMIVPGNSSACVQLYDANGKRIGSWSFQTGWRGTPNNASLEFSADLASDLIVLDMTRFINGRNIAKEYFAIANDKLRFVRMEDEHGNAVQSEYVFPNYEIGIVPEAGTVVEWAALLESTEKADVLAALMFLGGRHLSEPQRQFGPEPHESSKSNLFQNLIASPRIREVIDRLATSENKWIEQAALLAARPSNERPLQ